MKLSIIFGLAVKTKKEDDIQEFIGTRRGAESVRSGSDQSEQVHLDKPIHSAVVTVITQVSDTNRKWVEMVPEMDLQSVLEQAAKLDWDL